MAISCIARYLCGTIAELLVFYVMSVAVILKY